MEILASTIIEIGKCLYVPVERHIGYLIAYKRNVNTLRNQVEELGTSRDDVKRRIEVDKRSGKVIRGVVEEWITKVDRIEEEARRLYDEVNENKRCFSGWCPSLSWRYGLGKKAKKMVVEVNSLQQEGEFSVVSDPAPHPSILSIPTGDFVDFGSTKSAMNQIEDALKDEENKVVGVYGLGGVGKTSLMVQVGKQMKNENLYDGVVKVTVSQNPVLEKIQAEIANKIGLKFDETSKDSKELRAARLHARLKQLTRVLLILDDLWEHLELSEVGIPQASEHDGCQIVVTTRNLQVCTAMMSQATIEVKVLSADDSWVLFKKYAGDFIESPSFHTVARDVVKECGGLPLAIITLGRALREKDLSYWVDALKQLERANPTGIIDTKFFNSLMLSYEALESEEMKSCFLFCCLFPEDYNIEIEELIQFGIGEGLYRGAPTLNEARGSVRILVENLKARCMLLEGDMKECVKMHDILRDLAIKISSEIEDKFLVKARQGLKRWPEREEVDKCYKISLMNNEISILPDQPPTCPKLRTLLLSLNRSLKEIPDNFFDGMKNLVVLDLSGTSISYLPSSFSRLINLRTLSLQGCHTLKDISLLGKLKTLEILRLTRCSLNSLPEEIGELTNLKLLDLGDNYNLKIVPPNMISRLTFLEELYMENGFNGWELQGEGPGHNASFAEVASLAYLTVLHVHINDVEILSQENFPTSKNLTEFDIVVGEGFWYERIRGRRRMGLQVSNPLANWVKELAERIDYLYLTVPKNSSFENVKPLLKSSCLTALYFDTTNTGILSQDICCRWRNLTEFDIRVGEYVAHSLHVLHGRRSMKLQVSNPLANWVKELAERTEELYLHVPKNSSFENVKPLLKSSCLTALYVSTNDMGILSQDICCRWRNLTEFDIRVCKYVAHSLHVLHGRRSMKLEVSNPLANWVKELAERTEELHLNVPKNSSFENVKPLLKSSCLTALYFDTTDTDILSQDICCRWANLTEFRIRVGESAQNVGFWQKCIMSLEVCGPIAFASWVMELAERTEALKLTVDNNFVDVVPLINSLKSLCFNVEQEREHLIKVEDVPENAFGRLERLYLSNLGKVKKLCEGPIPSGFFGNLKHLDLTDCNNLRYLWPFFPCHASQQLESLEIYGCKELEGLIPRKEEESVVMEGIASPMLSESHTRNSPNFLPPLLTFQNLRKLEIWSCPSLKYIFSWKFANGLNQLEELLLCGCNGMEVIFAEVDMEDSGVLPQLKTLTLRRLRSLVSFFQGEASLDMTSLEIITIEGCENLKRLPLGTQSAPNLKEFEAKKEWFESLEWREGSITKSRLQPLFKDNSDWSDDDHANSSDDDHAETSAVEADSESFDQAELTPAIETGTSDQAAATFAKEADSRVDSESGPESMH